MKSQLSIAIVTIAGLTHTVQSLRAQQQIIAGIELSPFPIYPGDNSPDLDSVLKGKAVFYDIAKREMVVLYDDPQQTGTRKVLRLQRRNQVQPVVTSAFSKRADGAYLYEYSVFNAPNAARKMNVFALSAAVDDGKPVASHASWSVTSVLSDLTRPGSVRPEVAIIWMVPPGKELDQGAGMAGFKLVSRYRPGLVIGYAQASVDADISNSLVQELPENVKSSLAAATSPRWNANQFMTIAPKFKDTDPKVLIAIDFKRSLTQLSLQGPLKKDSPFVSSALGILDAIISNPAGGTFSLDTLAQPSAGLESEIAAAMRVSLQ